MSTKGQDEGTPSAARERADAIVERRKRIAPGREALFGGECIGPDVEPMGFRLPDEGA